MSRSNLHVDRLTLRFAAAGEPFAHRFRQSRGFDAQARFEPAFAGRQRVVEFGLTGEITHAKRIEPFQRAWPALSRDNDFDEQFLRVH